MIYSGDTFNTLFVRRYSVPRFIGKVYPLHRFSMFLPPLSRSLRPRSTLLLFSSFTLFRSLIVRTQSTTKYNGNQPGRSRSELMNEIKPVPFVDSSLTNGRQIARRCKGFGKRVGFVANSDRYDAYTPGSRLRYYRRVPLRLPISPTFSERARMCVRACVLDTCCVFLVRKKTAS